MPVKKAGPETAEEKTRRQLKAKGLKQADIDRHCERKYKKK